MSARTKDDRLNEKADEVFDMLVSLVEGTTCDQFRCGDIAVWGPMSTDDDDYPACVTANECTRCKAKKLIKWIKEG
jgi:hypothetical protein